MGTLMGPAKRKMPPDGRSLQRRMVFQGASGFTSLMLEDLGNSAQVQGIRIIYADDGILLIYILGLWPEHVVVVGAFC